MPVEDAHVQNDGGVHETKCRIVPVGAVMASAKAVTDNGQHVFFIGEHI